MATTRVPRPTADDPGQVDPKPQKVEFESHRLRVLRIKYGLGVSRSESIAVFLTEAHAKFTYPEGRTEDISASAGSVQHMGAFTHLAERQAKLGLRSSKWS